jgi:hypothetical protein
MALTRAAECRPGDTRQRQRATRAKRPIRLSLVSFGGRRMPHVRPIRCSEIPSRPAERRLQGLRVANLTNQAPRFTRSPSAVSAHMPDADGAADLACGPPSAGLGRHPFDEWETLIVPFIALQTFYHPLIWIAALWAVTLPGSTISLAVLFRRKLRGLSQGTEATA